MRRSGVIVYVRIFEIRDGCTMYLCFLGFIITLPDLQWRLPMIFRKNRTTIIT
jgi:hypothetical protein